MAALNLRPSSSFSPIPPHHLGLLSFISTLTPSHPLIHPSIHATHPLNQPASSHIVKASCSHDSKNIYHLQLRFRLSLRNSRGILLRRFLGRRLLVHRNGSGLFRVPKEDDFDRQIVADITVSPFALSAASRPSLPPKRAGKEKEE